MTRFSAQVNRTVSGSTLTGSAKSASRPTTRGPNDDPTARALAMLPGPRGPTEPQPAALVAQPGRSSTTSAGGWSASVTDGRGDVLRRSRRHRRSRSCQLRSTSPPPTKRGTLPIGYAGCSAPMLHGVAISPSWRRGRLRRGKRRPPFPRPCPTGATGLEPAIPGLGGLRVSAAPLSNRLPFPAGWAEVGSGST